jgi:UDP-N-acetylmuramyl pentapeptide synthase
MEDNKELRKKSKEIDKKSKEIFNQLFDLIKKNKEITTDSRTVSKGSVFFALKGDNFDGNKFAKMALDKGS